LIDIYVSAARLPHDAWHNVLYANNGEAPSPVVRRSNGLDFAGLSTRPLFFFDYDR